MKIKAYSYIRFSSKLQTDNDSLRRQTELSERYAAGNDLELVKSYQDLAVSGFSGKNRTEGALKSFKESVKSGKIQAGSYLLVENLDRISREEIEISLAQFMEIINLGIVIVTLQDNQIYRKGSLNLGNLITSLIIMFRAYEESKSKSNRMKAGWAEKRKRATDKIITRQCPAWLTPTDDRKGFDVIKEHAKTINLIFDLCISGMGYTKICDYLNSHDIPLFRSAEKRKNKGWYEAYLIKLLNGKAVLGVYTFKDETIENYFPQVITPEKYYQAQSAISVRNISGRGKKGKIYSNLFSGLLYCGCGSSMRYRNSGKNLKSGDNYLQCNNRILTKGCDAHTWKYDEFEYTFLKWINEVDISEFFQEESEVTTIQNNVRSAEHRINEIEQRMATLEQSLDDVELSASTLKIFDRKLQQLEKEKQDVEHSLKCWKEDLKRQDAERYITHKNDIDALQDLLANCQTDQELKWTLSTRQNKVEFKVATRRLFMPLPVAAL